MRFVYALPIVSVFIFAAGVKANVIINLSVEVDPLAHTWVAFAKVNAPANETLGLHRIWIDVVGGGGTTVTSSHLSLPSAFHFLQSDGNNGIFIGAGQNPTNDGAILTGVGMITPQAVGAGTYIGDLGTLTVSANPPVDTHILPSVLPGFNQGIILPSPDAIVGQTVSVPEPSILFVAAACVGLCDIRRNRPHTSNRI